VSGVPLAGEPGGRTARWFHARRVRIALFIAFVESILVLFSAHGWYYVLGAAIVAVAIHVALGRRSSSRLLYEITWTAAVSQLLAVLVPVLWAVVKLVAIVVLVILAVFLLAALLIERR